MEEAAISATAAAKTCSLCGAGLVNPEIFRTYWRAAASISSLGAGVVPSLRRLMDRHMPNEASAAPCDRPLAGAYPARLGRGEGEGQGEGNRPNRDRVWSEQERGNEDQEADERAGCVKT